MHLHVHAFKVILHWCSLFMCHYSLTHFQYAYTLTCFISTHKDFMEKYPYTHAYTKHISTHTYIKYHHVHTRHWHYIASTHKHITNYIYINTLQICKCLGVQVSKSVVAQLNQQNSNNAWANHTETWVCITTDVMHIDNTTYFKLFVLKLSPWQGFEPKR